MTKTHSTNTGAPQSDALSLVADIGGTNTRVALCHGETLQADSIKRYANAGFDGLEAVLAQYIKDTGATGIAGACVALAGPVRNGVGEMTNLDWRIDGALLTRATGAATTAILNDLEAQGHALGHVDATDIVLALQGNDVDPSACAVVIGVGTGFNMAPVYQTASGPFVAPSESGHASLPVRDQRDLDLCKFVEKAHGFAGVEDVLSGRGLERVYAFLNGGADAPKAADIMTAFDTDPIARDAVAMFVRFMGMVAGNFALNQMAFGGIYFVGGVARAMAPHFAHGGFEAAFKDKGRFGPFMDGFSVSVVTDDYAALRGNAAFINRLTAAI